jgi:hypothetical protein
MKTLHSSVSIEKEKTSTSPFLVVEIQYDIGTKYYSEKTLSSPATEQDFIVNASQISQEINEDKGSCQGVNIEISDVSKIILAYLRQAEIYKKAIKVYQCFDDIDWANQTLIWTGTI